MLKNDDKNVKFSIITVAYNAEKYIEMTINSILSQTYSNFEVIIKDGLSKDATLSKIPEDYRIIVESKSDNGIYDAMNQATIMASGDYCIYMNCGDLFADDFVLENIAKVIVNKNYPELVYGDYQFGDVIYRQASKLTDFYLYRTPINHQSMFFSRKCFDDISYYDTKYRILADYNLTLTWYFSNIRVHHTPVIVCRYLGGGVSESESGRIKKELERKDIIKDKYNKIKRVGFDFLLILSLRKFRIWLFSGIAPIWLVKFYRKVVNWINGSRT